MFVWIFFFIVVATALIIMSAMRQKDRPVTRLNREGLPRPFERSDQNDEE